MVLISIEKVEFDTAAEAFDDALKVAAKDRRDEIYNQGNARFRLGQEQLLVQPAGNDQKLGAGKKITIRLSRLGKENLSRRQLRTVTLCSNVSRS